MTYNIKAFEQLMHHCKSEIDRLKDSQVIEEKKEADFVTNVDLHVEELIIKFLESAFPNDAIISEETRLETLTNQPTWIIDPIDGTNNFTQGSKIYGIQLCHVIQLETTFSVLYLPEVNDFYYAIKGGGAYLNGKPLLAKNIPLKHAIVSFGGFSKSSPESRAYELKCIDHLKDQVMGIRIFGSSCMDFSALASGQIHAHVMFSKRIWEIEAGLLLLQEAQVHVERIQIPNREITAICGAHSDDIFNAIKAILTS